MLECHGRAKCDQAYCAVRDLMRAEKARADAAEARLANLKAENRTLANAGVIEQERREAAEARLARAEALLLGLMRARDAYAAAAWNSNMQSEGDAVRAAEAAARALLAEQKG